VEFHRLVLQIAAPHARLFDFGAGPGIDARFFAELGFSVSAYDVDPEMCKFFTEYCEDFIESGRIALEQGTYRDFLSRAAPIDAVDLVISNFAPLNLVPDVQALFAKFHELTGPNGKVLASVLNPFFLEDLKSRFWWRSLPRLWREGHYYMPGPQAPHMRRRAADFAALSAPHFKLTRIVRRATARFMFLLFEKTS
jgi:SAM-dependent methyltransferase